MLPANLRRTLIPALAAALWLCALSVPALAQSEPGLPAGALPTSQSINQAPIAQHLSVTTYKNVEVTGYFSATDPEGDALTYQLTSTPARGSVAIAEDGTGRFVFTPYENKTGKDSFTYVAVDVHGNISNPGKVSLRIEKNAVKVTYSDMSGNGAHKAAVRLAQEGIFTGTYVNGNYFFQPEQTMSRSQFLSMAMAVSAREALSEVTLTGFADDEAIPTWAKGYVAGALKSGAISGSRNDLGQMVFRPDSPVTCAEAAVMLDRLLGVSDVAVETWSAVGVNEDTQNHWAAPSAIDLACAGILPVQIDNTDHLDAPLTRAQAALLLDASLDLVASRQDSGWFSW